MVDEATNVLRGSFPMVGGDGDYSYAKNSPFQRMIVDAAKEMINESISDKLDLKSLGFDSNCGTFQLADFGCSVGPNTFIAVQNIVAAVQTKYRADGHQDYHQNSSSALEFQVFFNDHYDNDFNTLFRTLPSSRKYFASGVPGSFHGRLFPKSSLHFAHSSNSLNWLSKIPKEILDSRSPAWNKGSIICSGLVKEVSEAYSAQFKNDVEAFLNARAHELVPGGLIVFVLSSLPNGVPMIDSTGGKLYGFLGSCLIDMAKKGLIDEEKVDSFNIPLYFPTSEELKAIIERNGCFNIERMDKLPDPPVTRLKSSPESATSQIRAVFEGVVNEHFGYDLVDKIFNFFTMRFAENFIFDELIKDHNHVNLFVLLKRVIN